MSEYNLPLSWAVGILGAALILWTIVERWKR